MRGIVLLFITGYRKFVSPLLPRACRYYPTCSSYSYQSIQRFGVWRGGWLSCKRIFRCNPFSNGGYDPVPDK